MQRALILANGPVIEGRACSARSGRARVRTPADSYAGDPFSICSCRRRESPLCQTQRRQSAAHLSDSCRAAERDLILDALRTDNGNRQAAAKRLGISPRTLRYKLARLREAGVDSADRPLSDTQATPCHRMQIDAVLSQIRAMQSQIRGVGGPPNEVAQAAAGLNGAAQSPANSFANVLKQGLDQVNQTQQTRVRPCRPSSSAACPASSCRK